MGVATLHLRWGQGPSPSLGGRGERRLPDPTQSAIEKHDDDAVKE
jgi:hypothetical protein